MNRNLANRGQPRCWRCEVLRSVAEFAGDEGNLVAFGGEGMTKVQDGADGPALAGLERIDVVEDLHEIMSTNRFLGGLGENQNERK